MKASNAEQNEEQKGLKGIGKLLGFGLREARIFAVIAPLMYLVVMIVIVSIIGYGGMRVANGTMSTGSSLPFCFIFSKSLCRLPPSPCSLRNYKRQREQQKESSIY